MSASFIREAALVLSVSEETTFVKDNDTGYEFVAVIAMVEVPIALSAPPPPWLPPFPSENVQVSCTVGGGVVLDVWYVIRSRTSLTSAVVGIAVPPAPVPANKIVSVPPDCENEPNELPPESSWFEPEIVNNAFGPFVTVGVRMKPNTSVALARADLAIVREVPLRLPSPALSDERSRSDTPTSRSIGVGAPPSVWADVPPRPPVASPNVMSAVPLVLKR